MAEAVAQLERGLELLGAIPDGVGRQQQELELLLALGPALIATRGYTASNVKTTFVRALVLAEGLNRPEYVVPLLHGQWTFHHVRSEFDMALSLAKKVEDLGRARNDAAALLRAKHLEGMSRLFLGHFLKARALFEQCYGLAEPAFRATYVDTAADDPHTVMLAHLAVVLAFLGHVDQGRALLTNAASQARILQNAHFTSGLVSFFGCVLEWLVRSPQDARRHAEELLALSNEHGFRQALGFGMGTREWANILVGATVEPASLSLGLEMIRASGCVNSVPWPMLMLAEEYAKLGLTSEAVKYLGEARRIIEKDNPRWVEPELHRLRGDVSLLEDDLTAAEQNYRRALGVAMEQSAKLPQLCAATSLARLWSNQRKCTEAHDLLAPIYNWFTEGFDTPVLKEAKALLDDLI